MIYILYSLVSFLFLFFVIRQAKSKFSVGIIGFWLVSQPILQRPEFMISTPWGFDLQPARIAFLSMLVYFFTLGNKIFKSLVTKKMKLKFYEWTLLAFIVIVVFSLAISSLSFQDQFVQVTGYLTFICFYFISRQTLQEDDIKIVLHIFIYYAFLSVVVAIVQFFYFPDYFRVSPQRIAFGEYFRAFGFFSSEYELGVYLTYVSAIILSMYKNVLVKFLLIGFLAIGIVLTMHRGSWIVFSVGILFYLIVSWGYSSTTQKKSYFFTLLVSIFILIVISGVAINISELKVPQKFLAERVYQDQLTIRMDLNRLALYIVLQQPLGIGDYRAEEYWQLYSTYGLRYYQRSSQGDVIPYVIHNGILSVAVKFGILGMLTFTLFLFSSIVYFLRNGGLRPGFRLVQASICITFILINMSNDFSELGISSSLVFAILSGVSIEHGRNID